MSQSLEAEGWNAEYRAGRYENEPPVPFINTIINELGEAGKSQFGLYVGCGNGRNYIPLVESGLNLRGMDISEAALEQLVQRLPGAEPQVFNADFGKTNSARIFDYIVSIQTFQHGDAAAANNFFDRTWMALKPNGKLFLRVNSVATEIYHQHKVVEGNGQNGKTILYESGPKAGQKVHFYSRSELEAIAAKFSFIILRPLEEVVEERKEPATGTWTQWESVWQKV